MQWFLLSIFSLLFAYMGRDTRCISAGIDQSVGSVHLSTQKIAARIMLVVTLSLFIAIVGPSGQDHQNYVDLYNEYSEMNTDFSLLRLLSVYSIEPGYQFLNVLGNAIKLSEPFFFFFVSVIINSCYVSVLYRFKYPLLTTLVFILSMVFSQEINLVRQSLAMAVFVYALRYVETRNVKKYLLAIIVATTMHISAIFLVPVIGLGYINTERYGKIMKITLYSLWFVSLLFAFGFVRFNPIDLLSSFMGDSRYMNYVSSDNDMGFVSAINYFNILLVIVLLFFRNTDKYVYLYLFMIGCIMQNLSTSMLFMMRFSLYFLAIVPFFMSEILNYQNYAHKYKGVMKGLLNLVTIYFVINLISSYILGNPVIGSKMYSISDFFN